MSRTSQPTPAFFSRQIADARRFYLDLNPRPGTRLTVVCGGREVCAPDYAVERKTFPYHSIEFVARGRGTLRLDDATHGLQAGRLFAYAPGVPHGIATDRVEPLVKYFVDFAGTEAPKLLRRCHLDPGAVAQVSPLADVQAAFDELIRSGLRGSQFTGDICRHLLETLVLRIAESAAPLGATESAAFATYQACRDHVQRHYARLRQLREIARECHVSAAYLCRLFRRFDHQSPYQHLLRLKMQHAAELLQAPRVLVKQAAEEVGFADAFQFSRVFKQVFGVAPVAFRGMR